MSKISLAIIVKGTSDEVPKLDRCLASVAPFVDGIFITLTSPKEKLAEAEKVCAKYKVNVSYFQPTIEVTKKTVDWVKTNIGYTPFIKPGDKIFVFDEARNYNFSQVPKDYKWILWLDCDDVFRKGENLRQIIQNTEQQNATAIYMEYFYQVVADEKDEEVKQVIIKQVRERIVLNDGSYKWQGIIHEVLIEENSTYKVFTPDCDIVHLPVDGALVASTERNIRNLEVAIYKTEGKDNRYIYYLAKSFSDLRQPEYDILSRNLMFKHLLGENKTDWEEERAQVWEALANSYIRNGEYGNAISALMNGLIDYPESPTLFIALANVYVMKGEWGRALFWLNIGQIIPQKPTILAKYPMDTTIKILEIKYNVFRNLNRIQELKQTVDDIRKLLPNHPLFNNPDIRDDVTPVLRSF